MLSAFFLSKNLRISKKSSTFAPAFVQKAYIGCYRLVA